MRTLLLLTAAAAFAQEPPMSTHTQTTIQLPPDELAKLREMEKSAIPSDAPTTGTTDLVIRGNAVVGGTTDESIPRLQVFGTSTIRVLYPAYAAAISLDYWSTRHALSNGATDALYRCNPHRAGCMNQAAFWTVAAIPVATWLLHDLWLHKYTSSRWKKIERVARKIIIGGRAGVAAYNLGIANGIKGGRNGK